MTSSASQRNSMVASERKSCCLQRHSTQPKKHSCCLKSVPAIRSLFFPRVTEAEILQSMSISDSGTDGQAKLWWTAAEVKTGCLLSILWTFWDPGYILWLLLSILFWKNMRNMRHMHELHDENGQGLTIHRKPAHGRLEASLQGELSDKPQKMTVYGKRLKGLWWDADEKKSTEV